MFPCLIGRIGVPNVKVEMGVVGEFPCLIGRIGVVVLLLSSIFVDGFPCLIGRIGVHAERHLSQQFKVSMPHR